MKFRTIFIIYGLFVLSALYGCDNIELTAKTGSGGDIILLNAGEDLKSAGIDNSEQTDNSVTNPEPVIEEAE